MSLFRLLRLPNLLIVALTQVLVYFYILRGSFSAANIPSSIPIGPFWLLVLATVLVSAAGYVINDLHDRTADARNLAAIPNVEKFGVGRSWRLYAGLVSAGTVLSIYLAARLEEWEWFWLYPLATGLLAAYSPYIKPRPFWGNFLVALYCAGVPGLIWLGERDSLATLATRTPAVAALVDYTLLLFMVFAFTVTLLREIVKDLEDETGDRSAGRRTLPIAWGPRRTRRLALGLGIGLALGLPLSLAWEVTAPSTLLVFIVGILTLLLCLLLIRLSQARNRRAYGSLSLLLKWYMLGGLIFLLLFRWYR